MKISVVMSTYNGSRDILEQLQSLVKQTKMPDEVLIIDDCSTDNTYDIVSAFIKKCGLENWKIIRNKKNQGWQTNFANGIDLCSGDIIFTCDQDDIWLKDKIESMVYILSKDSQIKLLAGDYILLEERSGKFFEKNIFKNSEGTVEKKVFDERFFYVQRPGCVYAFKRELWELAKRYTFKNNPHDALLWRTANLIDGLYLYRKPVILWRRHKNAQTNGVAASTREKQIDWCNYVQNVIKSMNQIANEHDIYGLKQKSNYIDKFSELIKIKKRVYQKESLLLQCRTWMYYKYYPTNKGPFGETIRVLKMILYKGKNNEKNH